MSTRKPIIPLIPTPVGMDKAIQRLQIHLGARLEWLTYSFGRATIGKTKGADDKAKIRTAPEVYMGDGRYEVVEPNNQWAAHSYIQQAGAEKPLNFKTGQKNDYATTLELVVLVDLDQVKKVAGYKYTHRFTEELKQEIKDALRYLPQYTIMAIHETPGEVLRGYSYDAHTHQTFRHPKAGFKFVLEVSYSECA